MPGLICTRYAIRNTNFESWTFIKNALEIKLEIWYNVYQTNGLGSQ